MSYTLEDRNYLAERYGARVVAADLPLLVMHRAVAGQPVSCRPTVISKQAI